MAYVQSQLRRMDYGATLSNIAVGFWSYVTNDAAATVETAGYFNSATTLLQKGDIVQVCMAMGVTPVLKEYIVTSATGAATVVIALQTVTAG